MPNINLTGVSVSALTKTVNMLKPPQCQMAENSSRQLKLMQNLNCSVSYILVISICMPLKSKKKFFDHFGDVVVQGYAKLHSH
jgi:SNF family Na+-dependent transporter